MTHLDISRNKLLTAKKGALAIVNNLMFRVLRRGFSKIIRLDLLHSVAVGVPLRERQELTSDDVSREIHSPSKPVELTSDLFNLNDKVHFLPSCGEVDSVAMPKHVFGFVLDTFIWYCSSHIRVLHIRGFPDIVVGPLDPKNDLTNSSLFIMAAKCNVLESVDFSYRECITDDEIFRTTVWCGWLQDVLR
eukprot:gene25484-31951_t